MPSQPPPGWDGHDEPRPSGPSRTTSGGSSRPAYVVAPDGAQWRVRRRGLTRVRLNWPRWCPDTMTVVNVVATPDSDLASWLLAVLLLAAAALVLIPLLFFGFELVIAGCVLAVGLLGRLVSGRPWVVEATTVPGTGTPRSLEWQVKGWRRSAQMVRQVSADIEAGRDPLGSTQAAEAR